jgi:hypothetical protein
MMWRAIPAILLALFLTSCGQSKPRVVSSPYADGRGRAEPVFYNGKRYKLGFTYRASRNVYDLRVSGNGGRKLGSTPGDEKIVHNMASSALAHFACARGQKAVITPGTSRHANGMWHMQARCI